MHTLVNILLSPRFAQYWIIILIRCAVLSNYIAILHGYFFPRDARLIDNDSTLAAVAAAAELLLDIKSAIAYIILLIKHSQFIVLCLIVYGAHTHSQNIR